MTLQEFINQFRMADRDYFTIEAYEVLFDRYSKQDPSMLPRVAEICYCWDECTPKGLAKHGKEQFITFEKWLASKKETQNPTEEELKILFGRYIADFVTDLRKITTVIVLPKTYLISTF